MMDVVNAALTGHLGIDRNEIVAMFECIEALIGDADGRKLARTFSTCFTSQARI